jgi:hypothetical protein
MWSAIYLAVDSLSSFRYRHNISNFPSSASLNCHIADPLYQHLIVTAERKFWRRVESGVSLPFSVSGRRSCARGRSGLRRIPSRKAKRKTKAPPPLPGSAHSNHGKNNDQRQASTSAQTMPISTGTPKISRQSSSGTERAQCIVTFATHSGLNAWDHSRVDRREQPPQNGVRLVFPKVAVESHCAWPCRIITLSFLGRFRDWKATRPRPAMTCLNGLE